MRVWSCEIQFLGPIRCCFSYHKFFFFKKILQISHNDVVWVSDNFIHNDAVLDSRSPKRRRFELYLKKTKKPNDIIFYPTKTKRRCFGSGLQKRGTLVFAFLTLPKTMKKRGRRREEEEEEEEKKKKREKKGKESRRHACSKSQTRRHTFGLSGAWTMESFNSSTSRLR